jgi:hypothetical protein
MKSYIKNSFFGVALVAAFLFSFTAKAGNDEQTKAVELKYVGTINNKPVFQLNIANGSADKEYILSITDEFGNMLYKAGVKNNSSKKFLLNTDEINLDDAIKFVLVGRTTNKKFTYEINRISRTLEETSVVALK